MKIEYRKIDDCASLVKSSLLLSVPNCVILHLENDTYIVTRTLEEILSKLPYYVCPEEMEYVNSISYYEDLLNYVLNSKVFKRVKRVTFFSKYTERNYQQKLDRKYLSNGWFIVDLY